MPDVKTDEIIIKRQNFDKALQSIQAFTNKAIENKPLEKVPAKKRVLWWEKDNPVKGNDLNIVVSGVNANQAEINSLKISITDFANNLCETLNYLDNEYLVGIVGAAKVAKNASDKATENVKTIRKTVDTLKQFNEKIKNLEHLIDVDRAWELLEGHKNTLKSLCDYKDEISSLNHLMDVDDLWESSNSQSEILKNFEKKVEKIHKLLDEHSSSISDFVKTLEDVAKDQRIFVKESNKKISEQQSLIDKNLKENKSEIQKELDVLNKMFNKNQEELDKKFTTLSNAQEETLDFMQKGQADALSHIENVQAEAIEKLTESQTATLNNIEKIQNKRLEEISKEYNEVLSYLVKEQNEKFDSINTEIQREKVTLNEQVNTMTQKIKIAYIIAGSSATITVLHIILDILGVV